MSEQPELVRLAKEAIHNVVNEWSVPTAEIVIAR